MNKHNIWLDEGDLMEHDDSDGILFIQEWEIYELVDFLMHDVKRLRCIVMETREQVNKFAPKHKYPPYLMTAEDVFDCSFDDHPAMIRYIELYGGGKLEN
jgi:hypothetical protein